MVSVPSVRVTLDPHDADRIAAAVDVDVPAVVVGIAVAVEEVLAVDGAAVEELARVDDGGSTGGIEHAATTTEVTASALAATMVKRNLRRGLAR